MAKQILRWGMGRRRPSAGVSLIEALVALLVMSLGMLALVGVQNTLRFNADLSRQRVEAARIAAAEIESMRYFATLAAQPGQTNPSWDELATRALTDVALPGATQNTAYDLTRTVVTVDDGLGLRKHVDVLVTWTDRASADRTDPARQYRVHSIIAAAEPALGSLLAVPASAPAFARRSGRDASIPIEARDMGNGTSAWKPQGDASGLVWVFDNANGEVSRVCSAITTAQSSLTVAELTGAGCTAIEGRLVRGTVRYNLGAGPLDHNSAANASSPALPLNATTPLVWHNDPSPQYDPINVVSAAPQCVARLSGDTLSIGYACVVTALSATGWGGQLNLLTDGSWTLGTVAGQRKVCRFTTASGDQAENILHPLNYCHTNSATPALCTQRVTGNLTHQNFLVIDGANTCPVDTRSVSAASGVLVNYNTRLHQDSTPVPWP